MSAKRLIPGLVAATVLCSTCVLLTYVSSADKAPQVPKGAQEAKDAKDLTAELGGADRFLTHVTTDKPIYRTGEKVYIRGVVLNAHNRQPLEEQQQTAAVIQIKGPKGDVVASGYVASQDSVLGFAWEVPKEQAGGEYTAQFTFPNTGDPPAERKFDIRSYRAPRLKTQIVFVRDGYGPGDQVAASLKAERAEGGFPEEAKVTVLARVDGVEVFQGQTLIDANGTCLARFPLPEEIARGEGSLSFVIEDGGVVETASKTIPILLQTVDVQMYPEGGDLVAGLKNRLYVAAQTPAKKPADIAGVIVDADGKQAAEFRTEHEGRGRVSFTPQAGRQYTLKITEPSGIKTIYPLPEVKAAGAVLSALSEVTPSGKPVPLQVAATESGTFKVILSRREVEVASAEVRLQAGKPQRVELKPAESADGVLIATVWDSEGKPLAERLVFRQPADTIGVSITADQTSYIPGGEASVKIKTTDAAGKPISAVVGVTVTDDSVLEMIEKREQAPRLPVMVLLENDVRELADAHVYLDAENPKAPAALDLLLGIQGWRRFAFVERVKFITDNGDAARRVLALKLATLREERDVFFFADNGAARLGGVRGRGIVERLALPQAEPAFAPPAPGADAPVEALKEDKKGEGAQDKAKLPAPAAAARPASGKAAAAADEAGESVKKLQGALQQAELAKKANGIIADDREEALGGRFRRRGNFQNNFVVVREYAHQVRPDRRPGQRVDFTETLYWHAGLRTDKATGEATVKFGLNDAVSSFRVFADAFAGSGALGTGTSVVESVEPFYVEPKLPLEVTSGDKIDLPLAIVNATPEALSAAALQITADGLKLPQITEFSVPADSRLRKLATIDVGPFSGQTLVTLNATAGPYADRVSRNLSVKPLGFPQEIGHGGMLFADETVKHTIVIPGKVVPGSVSTKISVFPTPMANLTAALERLIQEPNGCFEQTSSSTYPLVMAQQYFQSHAGIEPSLIERSNEMLGKGYDRLTGYECKSGGYEWFGEDPGHEALTAYGLMEFTDMAEVRNVDTAMLHRTRTWLLGTRDGQGGFKRERRALHTWLADADVSNAYITWALLSAGEEDLSREVAQVHQAAVATKNSYVLALAANVMILADRQADAVEMMDRLTKLQTRDGDVTGATNSIVGSGGEALKIEATALAALAWLSDRDYADFTDKAIRYLAESCKGGRFGSTQSTVLALKAIVANDKALARPKAPGSVQLVVDDKPVGEAVAFDTGTQGAIQLPEIKHLLTPGEHTVAVKMNGGSSMPYAVAVNLHTARPNSSEECRVRLEVALNDRVVEEGALTEAKVVCTNQADETIPTPVAIIGLPGGLEVRHDQLKELVKSQRIAAYEVIGREVVLYWRAMSPQQKVELPLSLTAAVPGSYTGPASRAYLYYTDEHKQWADPLKVEIRPRAAD